ncbi:MAG: hypothetical protein ABI876_18615, partial [Bacteroidota bacterium]
MYRIDIPESEPRDGIGKPNLPMRYSYPLVLCGVLLLAGCAHGRSQNTPKSDVAAQPGNAAKQDGPDEFIMVDKDPTWDQADLQRRIQYPEDAWRNNIDLKLEVVAGSLFEPITLQNVSVHSTSQMGTTTKAQ